MQSIDLNKSMMAPSLDIQTKGALTSKNSDVNKFDAFHSMHIHGSSPRVGLAKIDRF
jgi:hypothetical protein